jgi:hypothetical protein
MTPEVVKGQRAAGVTPYDLHLVARTGINCIALFGYIDLQESFASRPLEGFPL